MSADTVAIVIVQALLDQVGADGVAELVEFLDEFSNGDTAESLSRMIRGARNVRIWRSEGDPQKEKTLDAARNFLMSVPWAPDLVKAIADVPLSESHSVDPEMLRQLVHLAATLSQEGWAGHELLSVYRWVTYQPDTARRRANILVDSQAAGFYEAMVDLAEALLGRAPPDPQELGKASEKS